MLPGGGVFSQEHATVVVQGGSGMFHAPVLKTGQDNEIVFGKRVRDPGVFLQPFQRGVYLVKDDPGLGDLQRIGFPVVQRYTAPVTGLCLLLEFPGHKREQVSAQGLGGPEPDGFALVLKECFIRGGIGHGHPVIGDLQGQGVGRFQVGLVKTGKQRPGPVRDQQRVQEFFVPV